MNNKRKRSRLRATIQRIKVWFARRADVFFLLLVFSFWVALFTSSLIMYFTNVDINNLEDNLHLYERCREAGREPATCVGVVLEFGE